MAIEDEEEEEGKKKRKSSGGGGGGGGGGSAAVLGYLAGQGNGAGSVRAFAPGRAAAGIAPLPSSILQTLMRGQAAMMRGRPMGAETVTRKLNAINDMAPGTVYRYPPRMVHVFDYGNILRDNGGDPWLNHTLDVMEADALEMQDLQEHNEALNKYIRPGQTPAERQAAIIRGEKEERKLKGFWDEDRRTRRKTGIGSTAVSNVRIDGNRIKVRFGGRGKWYTYRGGKDAKSTSHEARLLLAAPSIGRAINGTWGQTHQL